VAGQGARFPKGHPSANLLRHNGLDMLCDEAVPACIGEPAFVDHGYGRCRDLAPLFAWFDELVG